MLVGSVFFYNKVVMTEEESAVFLPEQIVRTAIILYLVAMIAMAWVPLAIICAVMAVVFTDLT